MMTKRMQGALEGIAVMAQAATVENRNAYSADTFIGKELDMILASLLNIARELERRELAQPQTLNGWLMQTHGDPRTGFVGDPDDTGKVTVYRERKS